MKVRVYSKPDSFATIKTPLEFTIDIAYFNMVFPGDVVSFNNRTEIVKHVICVAECGYQKDKDNYNNPIYYSPVVRVYFYRYPRPIFDNSRFNDDGEVILNPGIVLQKRRFINWFRLLKVLITKKYLGIKEIPY